MGKKVTLLTNLIFVLFLASCDPIYIGEIRNYSDDEITIKVCGDNLPNVRGSSANDSIINADSLKNCKTIYLASGKVVRVAAASGIASPIVYEDLGFNEITINTKDGDIYVTGKQIMKLFEIEEVTNSFGFHIYDTYHITIGEKNE